ncbi:LAO/AO transport system kinase [Strigomonas culicis]|uniref:LAO/AO transport system kinase n=1 Tax=Strigomonas culicis TaxID=28005 RepID=S9W2R7_9TRYP|nr:LAO/AO transport system kinase [Strigomonas culicis]|eukprot:EPY30110.1 LAO/AO transport system kinase [Strigomonas culicis]
MNYISRPRIAQKIDIDALIGGNRRSLAKAITLAESNAPGAGHRLSLLLKDIHQKEKVRKVPRIALSGSPGAGKSSMLETLGYYLCEKKNMRVGILAVDPTSAITGGSILGDKTRMEKLATHKNSFVRPSPSGCHLGGVTARAWEVVEVLEAANFDVIFIETVGVGQSETQCKDLTDLMVLLVPPASGDELQGIKKGIVEVADMIVVTKNDGSRALLAQQTKAAYSRAVMYSERDLGYAKPVVATSAEQNTGIVELWELIEKMWNRRDTEGQIDKLRRAQAAKHFMNYFEMELLNRAKHMAEREMNRLSHEVWDHKQTPRDAGDLLVTRTLRDSLMPLDAAMKTRSIT